MPFDVRRFDIYRKIPKDLTQPTLTGAIISVCCCCFIAILFLSEFLHFINISVNIRRKLSIWKKDASEAKKSGHI